MKVLVIFAAIALVTLAVEDAASVKELDEDGASAGPTADNGGDDTHPAFGKTITATGEVITEGVGFYKRMPNFVGPKYGLPGYKESHDWEADYDMMSPLVFDYRWFRALLHEDPATTKLMSEEDLKTRFIQDIEQNEAPNCPQGNIWFNANTFYTLHQNDESLKMGGKGCKMIFGVYLTKGIFNGWHLVTHKTGTTDEFPTLGSRLFNPKGVTIDSSEAAAAYYMVRTNAYVDTPSANGPRLDNTFSPARHMTIVFWLRFGSFKDDEAPNAELFAYGGSNGDNYFRTGVGCLTTNIADTTDGKCYFIFVMQATATEYFHTYNDENFAPLRNAFKSHLWGHVLMMLTTDTPGGYGGTGGCPKNEDVGSACNTILELYINKAQIKIVDWADGVDWRRAGGWEADESDPTKPLNWQAKIEDVWSTKEPEGDAPPDVWIRRFWISAPNNCKLSGSSTEDFSQCGGQPKNGLTFQFPWFGAYMAGVWVCDFASIPSGAGGFGEKDRRLLAVEAFYATMHETLGIACDNTLRDASENDNSHAAMTDGDLSNKKSAGGR